MPARYHQSGDRLICPDPWDSFSWLEFMATNVVMQPRSPAYLNTRAANFSTAGGLTRQHFSQEAWPTGHRPSLDMTLSSGHSRQPTSNQMTQRCVWYQYVSARSIFPSCWTLGEWEVLLCCLRYNFPTGSWLMKQNQQDQGIQWDQGNKYTLVQTKSSFSLTPPRGSHLPLPLGWLAPRLNWVNALWPLDQYTYLITLHIFYSVYYKFLTVVIILIYLTI